MRKISSDVLQLPTTPRLQNYVDSSIPLYIYTSLVDSRILCIHLKIFVILLFFIYWRPIVTGWILVLSLIKVCLRILLDIQYMHW